MNHNYTDTELQSAMDKAFAGSKPILFDADPANSIWGSQKLARLDLIKFALAALPEPETMLTKPISPPTPNEAISLRDYFAGQALNAIASTLNDGIRPDELHFLTLDAYGIADAMLAAREVKP